jgi:hypothetical protein
MKSKSYYKSKVDIYSPYGIIQKGITMSTEKWKEVLVYEIGGSINLIVEKVPKPKKKDKMFWV